MSLGSLFLGILESVDVLRDSRIFFPPAEHGCLELHDVHHLKATTACGEVMEVGADFHLVLKGGGIFQR